MKKVIGCLMLGVMLLPVLGYAQMISVKELREQAEAIQNRWQKTYEAHGRTIEVDCAVIVPQVEMMPVLTIERLKPLREKFDGVLAAAEMVRPENPKFLLVPEDGETLEGTGMSDTQTIRFATNGAGLTADYERCQEVWIQQGEYEMCRTTTDEPMKGVVVVPESDYAWERPLNESLAVGNAHSVKDCMAFVYRWIEAYYPGEAVTIQPYIVDAYSPRTLEEIKTGKSSREAGQALYEGYYKISFEQVLEGVPLFQTIADYRIRHFEANMDNWLEQRMKPLMQSAENASANIQLNYRNDKWHYTFLMLDKVCEVMQADVPLAPLAEVMAAIEQEIEAGRIRKVTALRLGYIVYSDPVTTAYAWAIPSWLVDCEIYETEKSEKNAYFAEKGHVFWEAWEFAQVPVNAQTAEMIVFSAPSEEVYALPQITTWEETH